MNHMIKILYSIVNLVLLTATEVPELEFCTHKIVRVQWSSISKLTPVHALAQRLHEARFPNKTSDEVSSFSKGSNMEDEKDDSSEDLKAPTQIVSQNASTVV
jgi:hypothetical protein